MRPRTSFIVISYALLCLAGGFSLVMPESAAMPGVANGQTVLVQTAEAAVAVDAEPRPQIQFIALEP